jgi:hypothetical protein
MRQSLVMMIALGLLAWVATGHLSAQPLGDAAGGTVFQIGSVTAVAVPETMTRVGVGLNFVQAQPMNLPRVPGYLRASAQDELLRALTSQSVLVESGFAPGEQGNGSMSPVHLGVPNSWTPDPDEVTSAEFGTSNHPFSTAQADLLSVATNTFYPYRAAGKLFFNIGSDTFVCSASLIGRGIVVTAAHCVAEFGQNRLFANWQFVPGYRNGVAPFGVWTVRGVLLLTSYLDGSDPCAVPGIVCLNDVAVLVLHSSETGAYPGTATGWYSYGWNGFGFTGGWLAQITQLGYPSCLDNGAFMEVNNSYGVISSSLTYNIIIGSLMCGGSSGGPWLVNFGIRPTLTGTTDGAAPNPNTVVGVASWGSMDTGPKEMGASIFLNSNIVTLVNAACNAAPDACS